MSNKKINWTEIIENYKSNKNIDKDLIVRKTVALEDKFFIIGLLNDYIETAFEDTPLWTNLDWYRYEVYKRLLALGYYLGIVPIFSECTVEVYQDLEKLNILNTIINNYIDSQDYYDFLELIDKYNNINIQFYLFNFKKFVIDLFDTKNINQGLQDLQKTLAENEPLFEQMSKIIDFNMPKAK